MFHEGFDVAVDSRSRLRRSYGKQALVPLAPRP
jgi:hypothetical protein